MIMIRLSKIYTNFFDFDKKFFNLFFQNLEKINNIKNYEKIKLFRIIHLIDYHKKEN